MTSSDEQRLCKQGNSIRSKIVNVVQDSFRTFAASIDSTYPLCAYLCILDSNRTISLLTFGINDMDHVIKSTAESLAHNPSSSQTQPSLSIFENSATSMPMQQQIDILNHIPAQNIRDCSSSTKQPLYIAWQHTAPKHLLLHVTPSASLIKQSFLETEASVLIQRVKRPGVNRKRKRSCSKHLLFLRRLAATSEGIASAVSPLGMSSQTFKHSLSPVQQFQAEMCAHGHARILTFDESYFEIVWNKFDNISSEWIHDTTNITLNYVFKLFCHTDFFHRKNCSWRVCGYSCLLFEFWWCGSGILKHSLHRLYNVQRQPQCCPHCWW